MSIIYGYYIILREFQLWKIHTGRTRIYDTSRSLALVWQRLANMVSASSDGNNKEDLLADISDPSDSPYVYLVP